MQNGRPADAPPNLPRRAPARSIDELYGTANLTMLAQVNNRYRFGLGYRIAGSVNILLGMDIIDGLQLGYTYELPANGLIRESYGSHELYLAYGFNILKPKRTNRYKSVRYL